MVLVISFSPCSVDLMTSMFIAGLGGRMLSIYAKWNTNVGSEMYSIPFGRNVSKVREDSGSYTNKAPVTFHYDPPTSMLPEQWNVVSPVPTQRQELGQTMDLIPMQEHLLISVPELDQRLPALVCLNECKSESGLPTQVTCAGPYAGGFRGGSNNPPRLTRSSVVNSKLSRYIQ